MKVNSENVLFFKTDEEKYLQKQREQIVAQSNKLITRTRSQMKIRELRILLYLISKIRPDDKPGTLYHLSVAEIAKMSGLKNPHYSKIREIVNNINRMFWIEDFEPDVDLGMVWFNTACYHKRKGYIEFEFTSRVTPYLFALKSHYTSYPLSYILPMRSQYSIRLYELLKHYKSSNPNHEYFGVNLDDLKERLGSTYKTWQDFKRYALEPALGLMNSKPTAGEVNIYSDIKATYRVQKMGRAVDSVIFHIMKKPSNEIEAVLRQNEDYLCGDIIRPEEVVQLMDQVTKCPLGQFTFEDYMDASDLLLPGVDE